MSVMDILDTTEVIYVLPIKYEKVLPSLTKNGLVPTITALGFDAAGILGKYIAIPDQTGYRIFEVGTSPSDGVTLTLKSF